MTKLFSTYNLSGIRLKNRIVMAPMTRARAPNDVATEAIALYYAQRATTGLIVSEGTPVSREGQGFLFNPGIFSDEQVEGWKLTTQSVHAVGGRIFAQLWHVGRVSHTTIQEDGKAPVSATNKVATHAKAYGFDAAAKPNLVDASEPRSLETEEISRVVGDFVKGASNAMTAGFDGVEIHSANGYLFEQFLNPGVNDRTDKYSAHSIENRLRFGLEVVDAVCARIGKSRVGVRISPYGTFADMPLYDEIDETYRAYVKALGEHGIAYVHVNDQSDNIRVTDEAIAAGQRFDILLRTFRELLPDSTAIILAGGMNKERAEQLIADNVIDLAGFGRPLIANPDLVERLRNGWPLTEPEKGAFYGGDSKGLIDYAPYNRKAHQSAQREA